MALRLYNTLTKQKELFEPVVPGKVSIYLCGPTVYKPSHIGHAVGPVIFDALKKYLVYKGYDVKFVMNRFKEKRFAAGARREDISECEKIGLLLEEFIGLALEGMQGIDSELGL